MALGLGSCLPLRRSGAYALGSELLTNGGFDTDTVWAKGTGWTISGGLATFSVPGAVSFLTQTVSPTVGATYAVTIVVTSVISPLLTVRFTNAGATVNSFSPGISAPGTYVRYATLSGAADGLSISASASASGSVDSISLKKVL